MTVRQAEQRSTHQSKPGGKPAKDPNIADLEASISNQLGLKVQIIHKGDKGGEIRISYRIPGAAGRDHTPAEQAQLIGRRPTIANLTANRRGPALRPGRSGRHRAPGPPPRLRCWARWRPERVDIGDGADAAGGDHRNGQGAGEGGGRRHIHALQQPVAVDVGEKDGGDPGILEALAQFDRRQFADLRPALGGDLAALGVGADHDAAGEFARAPL